jgi:hypothetical protein
LDELILEKTKYDAEKESREESNARFERKLMNDLERLKADMEDGTEGQKRVLEERVEELETRCSTQAELVNDLQMKHDLLVR